MTRVLITGAGSGIGRAMAKAFAGDGARVWVTDIDAGHLGTLPEGWRGTAADAADEPAMAALFDDVAKTWGGLDVLCANAGIAGPTALVEDVTLDDWRACTAVNLDGAFLASKHAARLMKPAGQGAILITSSTAGLHGYPNRAPYAAAKWGVIGLMKTLAMELGPFGIRANAICPGSVEGDRMEGVLAREAALKGLTRDQVYTGYAAGTAMGRWITPEDIAQMALFLSSDAARLVSGQVISVDGHTFNPHVTV
ncbi:MAG: SDR family NAD(P)-dependent oxidoreductase [Rhodobacter sp.]|nr:SDR family NAD(P)-dependent oxidoreductase [Rhodobacter sp.]